MKLNDLTLPKSARLLNKGEFQRVFNGATKSSDQSFVILIRLNGEKPARLGLAISRKCSPRSVDRNRIKRLVRENFRLNKYSMFGRDLVVLCRSGAAARSNNELASSLRSQFQKIRTRL